MRAGFLMMLFTPFTFFQCTRDPGNVIKHIPWKNCNQKIIGKDQIKVCFDSLIEDSRCPLDMECFWEGIGTVRFFVDINGDIHPMSLSTINFPGYPSTDTSVAGYHFHLTSLLPIPNRNGPIPQSDYKADVEITKQ